ncbi:MAG: tRNA (adenosine(37)-N6)-threonylcarbamoyltransferase complex transferase subunit TsaD [Acidobacteriaceae bacterium]|nr:tRNA (adenosine(37)-N6)-threonylcarbamoyltransferase complex transferase subunit TsaD [Acidobacteriaceae bacterium]
MASEKLILGIESSCDETSAAVVRAGTGVLSNVVASQLVHVNYGGVVPELASREHLRAILPVVREAMQRAGVTYDQLDAVAVTEGPGLAGALLVGITFAKTLAWARQLPLIAVNHLEGHIHAVLMEAGAQFAEASPLLALVVSGGHTHLYLAENQNGVWRYRNVGRTVDDAAGEAYDKAAKLLGLPYPGGPWMDALASHGDPRAVPFAFAQIKQKVTGKIAPKLAGVEQEQRFDFSFSGIKTAVRRYTEVHHMGSRIAEREQSLRARGLLTAKPSDAEAFAAVLATFDTQTLDLIASFQHSVTGNLTRNTLAAAAHFGAQAIVVSGGVAANRELRTRLTEAADKAKLPIAFPQIALSTDNAAMIAAAAWPKLLTRSFAPETLEPTPQLRLG